MGSSKFARARALGSAALAGLELHWRPCLENLDLDDDSDFCWPSENGRSRLQPEIGSCTATRLQGKKIEKPESREKIKNDVF